MKTKLAIIATAGLFSIGAVRAETNNTPIAPDRITLCEVPLVCLAAPDGSWIRTNLLSSDG